MWAYAGIRRHVQTMLWVRACHSAMVLTLSMLRTRNCVSPRLRAWALAHSAVAAIQPKRQQNPRVRRRVTRSPVHCLDGRKQRRQIEPLDETPHQTQKESTGITFT